MHLFQGGFTVEYAIYVNGKKFNGTEKSSSEQLGIKKGTHYSGRLGNNFTMTFWGGFLILGQDVDKFVKNTSLPIKDQFGFEKMQSFSGMMSQLNFWSKILPQEKIEDLSNCKGKIIEEVFVETPKNFVYWQEYLTVTC